MPSDKCGASGYAEPSNKQFKPHHIRLADREAVIKQRQHDGKEYYQCPGQYADCGHTPDIAAEVDQRNEWRDEGELDEERKASNKLYQVSLVSILRGRKSFATKSQASFKPLGTLLAAFAFMPARRAGRTVKRGAIPCF